MHDALVSRGFDEARATETVDRLIELKLLDDLAFARAWATERSTLKGLAPTAVIHELELRGVDREVAEQAVAEAAVDEEARAKEVAARLVNRVVHLPLEKQASRLMGALLRRGYSDEAAEEGVRAVLPPEGWD